MADMDVTHQASLGKERENSANLKTQLRTATVEFSSISGECKEMRARERVVKEAKDRMKSAYDTAIREGVRAVQQLDNIKAVVVKKRRKIFALKLEQASTSKLLDLELAKRQAEPSAPRHAAMTRQIEGIRQLLRRGAELRGENDGLESRLGLTRLR